MDNQSQFTGKDSNTNSHSSQSQPQKDSPSFDLYRSIKQLPLRKFEECLLNNNLHALVISGDPDPISLANAWQEIQAEYTDLIGSNEFKLYMELRRKQFVDETDLMLVEESMEFMRSCVRVLPTVSEEGNPDKLAHVEGLLNTRMRDVNGLLKTNFKIDWRNDPEGVFKRCINRSKALKINIALRAQEMQVLEGKFNEEDSKLVGKRDEHHFTGILLTLSRYNGYKISKDITVEEYCLYVKQYNDYHDQQRKLVNTKPPK